MRDVYFGKERAKVFALAGSAISLTPAIGPVIGGYADQFFGWESNFLILTLMGLLLILYCSFKLPETQPEKKEQRTFRGICTMAWDMLKNKHVMSCAFLVGACNGIVFSYYAEGPFIFIDILHFTPSQYGFLGVILTAATLSSVALSQKIAPTFKMESTILLGAVICLVGSCLFIASALAGWMQPQFGFQAYTSILFPLFVIFVGLWFTIPNCLSIALQDYQSSIGTAGSVLGAVYYVFISIFTAVMSILHDGTVLPLPAYVLFLSTLLVLVSYWGIYLPATEKEPSLT
jgi:MFS family permease